MFSGTNDQSGTVHVTLRNDFQAIAKFLLGQREGSIVLMEPKTGAIRAMWSYPSYDPNLVADIDYDAAYAYLTELQNDPRDPLLANAYQQRYMPGFDVQGADDRDRPRRRRGGARQLLPRGARVRPAADQRPDPELRRHDLRR